MQKSPTMRPIFCKETYILSILLIVATPYPSHLQHSATHCSTLQHTATCCNTLWHAATHCNTPEFIIAISLKMFVVHHHPLYAALVQWHLHACVCAYERGSVCRCLCFCLCLLVRVSGSASACMCVYLCVQAYGQVSSCGTYQIWGGYD